MSTNSPTLNPMPQIPFNRILSPVEHHQLRFLILDCPTDNTLPLYLSEMKSRNVSDVVRVCEPTYNKQVLEDNGIQVHDWPFKDGGIPPNELILQFLSLCDTRFGSVTPINPPHKTPCIAVHCVAGLGRAPILVAICLIEAGMPPIDAVEFVRQRRRGALNSVQLAFLMDNYKRQWAKKKARKRPNSPPTMAKEGSASGLFSKVFTKFSTKKASSSIDSQ